MLRITNTQTNRQTDYARSYLAREARHAAKHAFESDGKCRAWYIEVFETPTGAQTRLKVDYLSAHGEPRTTSVAL